MTNDTLESFSEPLLLFALAAGPCCLFSYIKHQNSQVSRGGWLFHQSLINLAVTSTLYVGKAECET